MNDNRIGATGEFPAGKLNEHDQGELSFRVGFGDDGLVAVEFGTPVTWMVMRADEAIEFAESLLRAATGARAIKGGKPNG